ncbi:uncharacterized protein BDR25DRAFT_335202 [Lindgomyces ingoldianus]|uniref:Uncharacterized protein n=1 Tax=Lindgomyces ingoldianus TaxID=673940 RepID=A0ACB6QP68_9PLEO|nr:uncharacterized protein BDR25DRAFT_335202 [Lindgomyces ingoldianus]KAF2468809.1 hypothetical protein BDR25DRAFT_335202 [Lindgomyces ingoldianus]
MFKQKLRLDTAEKVHRRNEMNPGNEGALATLTRKQNNVNNGRAGVQPSGQYVTPSRHTEFFEENSNTIRRGDSETEERDHLTTETWSSAGVMISETIASINFLKYSFWTPPEGGHYLSIQGLCCLIHFLGRHQDLDEASHDAISSLLNLLRRPTAKFAPYMNDTTAPHLLWDIKLETRLPIKDQLWTRLAELPCDYFTCGSRKVFRTWFQWVCYAGMNNADLEGIYVPLYWSRLQEGLLAGFSEQRKYCLGILRQSLLIAHRHVATPHMTFKIEQRVEYQMQYESYCNLFETIILDRYPNQVEACLPELSRLLGPGCLVHPAWISVMLSSALSPKIQDGIRKLIGLWYMRFVGEDNGLIEGQTEFFIHGFLPWATQGTLFTSSLISTRAHTASTHGAGLTNILCNFLMKLPTMLEQRKLFRDILRFIVDRRGKIFAYSILYLLEGLAESIKKQPALADLENNDVELLLQVYRLPGLAEVAKDLSATFCGEILGHAMLRGLNFKNLPGFNLIMFHVKELQEHTPPHADSLITQQQTTALTCAASSLQNFSKNLEQSRRKLIQAQALVPACEHLIETLETCGPDGYEEDQLYSILDAVWDEADIQDFRRAVVVKLPPLFFHPTCIQACIKHQEEVRDAYATESLTNLLTRVLNQLHHLAESRSYLLSTLTSSIRKACLFSPKIMGILPVNDFLIRFIENPPSPRAEFLFEIAAVEKLHRIIPHRTYECYYGKREWFAYACVIDLLNRFPESQLGVAKEVLRRLTQRWKDQKGNIPIRSKWKQAFQLQAMLVLSESCIQELDVEWYLDTCMKILTLEPWPRYRFLLEWIIARIYYCYPNHARRILPDIVKAEDENPRLVASLMKLAVSAASFLDSEDFGLDLMVQLIPFSASSKVQIRFEAQWSFPILWDLAERKSWMSILGNPAFKALDKHIRSLDKFNTPIMSSRTLKLDVVSETTITSIFQGDYLRVDEPEKEFVAREDFEELWAEDMKSEFCTPPPCIPLGDADEKPHLPISSTKSEKQTATISQPISTAPVPLQTKSSLDLSSLLPSTSSSPSSSLPSRPAPIILLATLIDNPTNLGGLSRIAESFGLESLMVKSADVVASKEFQSTAVTSYKHIPIEEVKVQDITDWLVGCKRRGYKIVGVEQTDRSGFLGEGGGEEGAGAGGHEGPQERKGGDVQGGVRNKRIGSLPKKCVLVLGSERGGITPDVLSVVDRCVEIKTRGVTRSLNVQTAAGIVLYEWWREWGGRLEA